MQIAYIAGYQSDKLVELRGIKSNRSLAGSQKIIEFAKALVSAGHQVDIFSNGISSENTFRFHKGFEENVQGGMLLSFAAAFDVRYVNNVVAAFFLWRLVRRKHLVKKYNLLIIYNLNIAEVFTAQMMHKNYNLPVVLELEDSAHVTRTGHRNLKTVVWSFVSNGLKRSLCGVIAPSHYLLSRYSMLPVFLLRGILAEDINNNTVKEKICLYTGTLNQANGILPMLDAWKSAKLPDWKLIITGRGVYEKKVAEVCERIPNAHFKGVVDRNELMLIMGKAMIGLNPHYVGLQGAVFAFKIIEYLGCGLHVITTRMDSIESEMEEGLTFLDDVTVETIKEKIEYVIANKLYEKNISKWIHKNYSLFAVSRKIEKFLNEISK